MRLQPLRRKVPIRDDEGCIIRYISGVDAQRLVTQGGYEWNFNKKEISQKVFKPRRRNSMVVPYGHFIGNHYSNEESLRRRQQREADAAGFYTEQQWLARVEFYGWRCKYCGCQLIQETLTKDHIKALANGGSHWPSNLAPACRPCNSWKRDKDVRVIGS